MTSVSSDTAWSESQETWTVTPDLLCDVTTHAASLLSLTLSSAPWQHFYFLPFLLMSSSTWKLQRSSRISLPLLLSLNIPLIVKGQMYFYGLNYYLCVANSKMLLYGMLKCKESQDSYVQENGSWKPWSLLAKLTHLVGIRESTN